MAEQFYTILTAIGKAKIANANVLGNKINLTALAVGDSNGKYYNPTENQETLVNEVWRGNIQNISIDKDNPNWIVTEGVIPSQIGGFTVREVGLFDEDGDLLVISKYPETYKPIVENGATKDVRIRLILEVSNAANVTLKINPAVIFATKEDVENVDKKVSNNKEEFDTFKTGTESHLAETANKLNNLNTNDINARREILDMKLKLDEMKIVKYLNKTGIGFYDLFKGTDNMDTVNTTATVDINNTEVNFIGTKLLKFLQQKFDVFNRVELTIYDKEREKFTVDVNAENSTEINMNITPGSRNVGEKFYYNGEVYTITGVEKIQL
mgnify:CR=1 FL=1